MATVSQEKKRLRPARRLDQRPAPLEQKIDAPASRSTPFQMRLWLILITGIFIALAARRPDCILNPQFWAEDGTVFFSDQVLHGPFSSLFRTYQGGVQDGSGYVHLAPRIVAAIAAPLPVAYAPFVYNLTALLIAAFALSLFALPWYRQLLESDVARGLLCLVASMAFYSEELIGTIAAAQWYLLPAVLLLVLRPPEVDRRSPLPALLGWSALALITGLTAPVAIIILPLCCWRAFRYYGRSAVISCGLVFGVIVQFLLMTRGPEHAPLSLLTIDRLVASSLIAFVYRVVLSSVVGRPTAMGMSASGMGGAVLLSLLIVVVWLTWFCLRLDRRSRFRVLTCIYLMLASVASAMYVRDVAGFFAALTPVAFWGAARYFFLPSCILAYLVALTAESVFKSNQGESYGRLAFAFVFLLGIAGNFSIPALEDLRWKDHAKEIQNWIDTKAPEERRVPLAVPVNPAGWKIELQ